LQAVPAISKKIALASSGNGKFAEREPFEGGPDSILYGNWQVGRAFAFVPAQAIASQYLKSFKEFPPRAKAASFTVTDAMDKVAVGVANTSDHALAGFRQTRFCEVSWASTKTCDVPVCRRT
jgi:hypothetical protein